MTHPDFGERGFEEELTPEQVAIADLAKAVLALKESYSEFVSLANSEIKMLKEDIKKLEQQMWTLKNEDKS